MNRSVLLVANHPELHHVGFEAVIKSTNLVEHQNYGAFATCGGLAR